jgi:hypothetical protein
MTNKQIVSILIGVIAIFYMATLASIVFIAILQFFTDVGLGVVQQGPVRMSIAGLVCVCFLGGLFYSRTYIAGFICSKDEVNCFRSPKALMQIVVLLFGVYLAHLLISYQIPWVIGFTRFYYSNLADVQHSSTEYINEIWKQLVIGSASTLIELLLTGFLLFYSEWVTSLFEWVTPLNEGEDGK